MAVKYKVMGEAALTQLIELCHTLALKPKFVKELPDTGDERYIYFVYNSESTSGKNIFDEYVWVVPTEQGVDPRWELLGSVALDIVLDDYVTKEVFETLQDQVEKLETAELSGVEFDTTAAPELTLEPSKEGTVEKVTVSLDLSDYAKKDDVPELEEITADEVQEMWDKYVGD